MALRQIFSFHDSWPLYRLLCFFRHCQLSLMLPLRFIIASISHYAFIIILLRFSLDIFG